MRCSDLSSGHAFFLGIMALVVAVMCITIRVIAENREARIIMATIWAIIGIWWLILAARSRRPVDRSGFEVDDQGGGR